MSTTTQTKNARFGRLFERRDDRDLPYYNGGPTEIATWKWLLIVLSCAVSFTALSVIPASSDIESLFPRTLFPVIMLVVFISFTGRFWTSIFKKPTGRDWLAMLGYGILTLAVSSIVGAVIAGFFGSNSNAATGELATEGPAELAAFFLGTGIQIFGEELFSILPFLALVYFLYTRVGLSRKSSIIIAWLLVAVWFGAAHLPTYGWNILQALVGIGVARLVLTLAFIRTKNIFVSTGAHIFNDWFGFIFIVVTSSAVAA